MKAVDLIITGEYLISDPGSEPIRDGGVAIIGDRIEFSGKRQLLLSNYTAKKVLERPGCILMPGLINAHTHAPMTLLRGIADDLPLKTWLEDHIFPREARLTPKLIEIGTELACAEMIRSGTTSFIDMYLFEEHICRVVDRVGMRAWLGEGLFDFPTPAFESGWDALKETQRLIDAWGDHPLITITIDPHTPYTCSPELLKAARDLQERCGQILVIHLAETMWEDQEIKKRYGASPARHLDNIGILNPMTLAVHVVHPSASDMELLAQRGVRVCHCPESNLKLASGIAPVKDMISQGITVLLGTDGAASNNNLDMLEEMGTAARLSKGVTMDPTALPAKDVLRMATGLASEALGLAGLGTLLPGAPADIVTVELNTPHMRPCHNPVSQLVYCANGRDVRDTVVAGRILMDDRVLKTIDEERVIKEAQRIADTL